MLLFLAGCGGGGGGGGGGGNLPALVYSGSSSQATVTTTNASRLAANVLGSADTANIIAGISTEGSGSERATSGGLAGVARTLNHATRRALAGGLRPVAPGVTINETDPCENGVGSVRTTGTLNDVTFTGTLSVTFQNCLAAGLTLNGTLDVQVLAFDQATCGGIPTNFIGSTQRITVRGNGVSADAGGSLQVVTSVFPFPMGTETVTNNLVNLNNLTGVMTKAENLVSTGTLDFVCTPTSISGLSFSGRIFDNTHGFVDVTTITLLQITTSQVFPNTGEIRLAGGGNPLHVRALSPIQVELQFDTNADNMGDGFAARMKWTELSGPIGADIADADGDGMHNSWETFYGGDLVPTNNNDLDGGDNLAEYQASTNPNVAGQ
jgi:hypothetical protein